MSMVVNLHKNKYGIVPHFDVYIGRMVEHHPVFTKNSKWCNPGYSLEDYELYILDCIDKTPEYYDLNELKGMVMGCWCITTNEIEPLVCHGQVLLKILIQKFGMVVIKQLKKENVMF